jgi:hypothetical protein
MGFISARISLLPSHSTNKRRNQYEDISCSPRRRWRSKRTLYVQRLSVPINHTNPNSTDTLPTVNGAAVWTNVRQAKNWQNNGFVGDPTSSDIRCNQLAAGTATASVAAGGSVKVNVNPSAYHPGPFQSYLARVPDGANINTWDPASSAVWFRIYAEQPKFGSQLTWLSMSPLIFPSPHPPNSLLKLPH